MGFDCYLPILLKGLLKDKGGVEYLTPSVSTLRNRINDLEKISQKIVDEMKLAEKLFLELIEEPRPCKLRVIKLRNNMKTSFISHRYSLVWRIALNGMRTSDAPLFSTDESSIKLLEQLSPRIINIVADFEKRRVFLNNSLSLTNRELLVNVKHLEELLVVDNVLNRLDIKSESMACAG